MATGGAIHYLKERMEGEETVLKGRGRSRSCLEERKGRVKNYQILINFKSPPPFQNLFPEFTIVLKQMLKSFDNEEPYYQVWNNES